MGSSEPTNSDHRAEIERLSRELTAAQQERSQSAAYGLELLNEKENLQAKYEAIETKYEQSQRDLHELREAWNKAINEQRISATTVYEKEVQLLDDKDALSASFTHAKQEIEKELRLAKSQLESAIAEKERYLSERDELAKKNSLIEQERKNLKLELKDLKSRESRLFNENSELEEENVSLQKQVSNLRSAQVEFESSKHEIQRLQDELTGLNSQLEEVVTLRRITERQMQEALEALQSEREQKYALRKELDKRNSAEPLLNWTSLAALKGSPHLANLALRGLIDQDSDQDGGNPFSDADQGYDVEMPSIEGSLFDEVHMTEIKKLQQSLEEKENQRSNLNTRLIEIQHKLDSKSRQADEVEKKLGAICNLVEEIYNELDYAQKSTTSNSSESSKQQVKDESQMKQNTTVDQTVSSTTSELVASMVKLNFIDDYENIYSHLQTLASEFKVYLSMCANAKEVIQTKKEVGQTAELNLIEPNLSDGDKIEPNEALQSDDVQSLRVMLYKKHEQLKQLRTILKSNKDSAEVALKNLKSKYNMEKAVVAETMTKLRLDHKRLNEDAATFASLRSHFSARIEEYNTEIEKLQSKLSASEQEKNTLNSILRMAIEQKVMLTQKLEALEMDREDPHLSTNGKNNGGQPARASGPMRGRSGGPNRGSRMGNRGPRPSANERR